MTEVTKYTPSDWAKSRKGTGHLWPCTGLEAIVRDMLALDWSVYIDMADEGEPEGFELVTVENCVQAANEMEEARFFFQSNNNRTRWAWLLVIPSNDEDWLVDYNLDPVFSKVVDHVMGFDD